MAPLVLPTGSQHSTLRATPEAFTSAITMSQKKHLYCTPRL